MLQTGVKNFSHPYFLCVPHIKVNFANEKVTTNRETYVANFTIIYITGGGFAGYSNQSRSGSYRHHSE